MSNLLTPQLSVVIPAYNEEKTIVEIVNQVLRQEYVHEIIIVNDCSKDKTVEVLNVFKDNKKVRLINHVVNQGKTGALKTGFSHVTGNIVIIQDADLEYDPDEYKYILEPIIQNRADVVYGSRFLVRKASRVHYFFHYVANKSLTFFMNIFTNMNMTDIETCYKCFKAPIIKNMQITSKGFGFEVEVTANIAKLQCRVYEVPISYYGRSYEDGKKIGMTDGFHALWYIIKYNLLNPLNKAFKISFKTIKEEMCKINF
jgi:glycosyltransferase involved in cell wall biosynthesis